MDNLTTLPAWHALQSHHKTLANKTLRALFTEDAQRFEKFSIEAAGLLLDFSKNRITQETMRLLVQLAEEVKLSEKINELFSGKPLNFTEQRSAIHAALRDDTTLFIKDENINSAIQAALKQVDSISTRIRQGKWLGYSQQPITDVVNLGIGGSYLGPAMVTAALKPYIDTPVRCHFVANVDSPALAEVLAELNPQTTLFIISSKSFTTIETITNADTAKKWLQQHAGSVSVNQHFLAITADKQRALAYGIHNDNILPIWEGVGGRYSLWSAIGLPIAIAIGMPHFRELLRGAHAMDQHFRQAPFTENMPVIAALLMIWYINFFGANTQAILPYDYRLRELPRYLQQLEMESNGKRTQQNGQEVNYTTGAIIWGEVGTNGQHAFHQLLFQGTQLVPCDFIAVVNNPYQDAQHELLFANCLAQSRALMWGKIDIDIEHSEFYRHKLIPGNQPSNTLIMPELTPHNLGALIALYEHKVFVQSIIWNINAFDQWGVEIGKQIAKTLMYDLANNSHAYDASTNGLLDYYHCHKNKST